jgi:hypothetical protein
VGDAESVPVADSVRDADATNEGVAAISVDGVRDGIESDDVTE